MSKDENLQQASERDKINLDENYEVEAWCQMFGISTADLKRVIDAVGPSALKVKQYLDQHNVNTTSALRI